jgi:type II secretory pathway pseudopilin PulG
MEVLVAVTVFAVIASVVFLVAKGALWRSRERYCMNNLQKIHLALSAYRADYDGEGKYGYWTTMGLPRMLGVLPQLGLLDRDSLHCRGVPDPNEPDPPGYGVMSWAAEEPATRERLKRQGFYFEPWTPYVQKYKDNAILVFDLNHQYGGRPYGSLSVLEVHRALGLTVGGEVLVRVGPGSPTRQRWWH